MNEHLSSEILAAYVDGRLEKEQRAGVEAHLSRCRECRQALADVAEMLANREKPPAEFLRQGLKASGAGDTKRQEAPGGRALLLQPAFGVAAVFLVAVIAGFFFLGRGRMELPRPVEKEMPDRLAAKAESPEPVRDEVAPAVPAAPEMGLEGRSDASGSEKSSGPELKKKLAAETPGFVPPPVSPLPEAVPVATPAEMDLPRRADTAGAARYNEMEEGVIGEVPGGVETQAEEIRGGEMKAVFAQKATPRPAGSGKTMSPARGPHPAAGLNAVSGALQIVLATSGRAVAPMNLGFFDLAAGSLVRIEGDVAEDDLLAPGLQNIREWLPEGSVLQVTIGADGQVTAVELLGDWEPGAAIRARKEAGKLIFRPARKETRRAVLARDLLT